MKPLTARQAQVLDFIEEYRDLNGIGPSYEEIRGHFGFASPNAATDHVRALRKKGYVAVIQGVNRNTVRSISSRRPRRTFVPLVGRIAAGAPLEAIENIETSFDLSMFGIDNSGDDYFALTVRGDSMINAHIMDGDMVVIKKQRETTPADISAVVWNNEATLKHVRRVWGGVMLIPANDAMEPVIIHEDETQSFEVLGRMVMVVRKKM